MTHWREDLNRLTIEFWLRAGDLAELRTWADKANAEVGEVHPDVWDLFSVSSPDQATDLLLKIASDVNGFKPQSWEAEQFAIGALQKKLGSFLSCELSIKELCELVQVLDAIYNIGSGDMPPRPESMPTYEQWWLGNLWNCCDWCDENWTFENSAPLVAEARRVFHMLANLALHRTASGSR